MPWTSSAGAIPSGISDSERAKASSRRVSAAARDGALHRMIEMVAGVGAGAGELALGKVDPADDDREHIVEIVRDAAGELADRLHLLRLAQLLLGGGALGRLGAQPLVGLAQLAGAIVHRLLEARRAQRFAVGILPREILVGERAIGEQAEDDRADADQHAEPAEPLGQPVGLGVEQLGLLDPRGEVLALARPRSRRA